MRCTRRSAIMGGLLALPTLILVPIKGDAVTFVIGIATSMRTQDNRYSDVQPGRSHGCLCHEQVASHQSRNHFGCRSSHRQRLAAIRERRASEEHRTRSQCSTANDPSSPCATRLTGGDALRSTDYAPWHFLY